MSLHRKPDSHFSFFTFHEDMCIVVLIKTLFEFVQGARKSNKRVRWADEAEEDTGFHIGGASLRQVSIVLQYLRLWWQARQWGLLVFPCVLRYREGLEGLLSVTRGVWINACSELRMQQTQISSFTLV